MLSNLNIIINNIIHSGFNELECCNINVFVSENVPLLTTLQVLINSKKLILQSYEYIWYNINK